MSKLNRTTAVRSILALTACLLSAQALAEEETAVTVFKRVSPSVVSLECAAGSGTGILLTSKGTILTSAHVVAVPLPFRCRVEVLKNGKPETVLFKRVTVVSIHPKLDLALVMIDPAEHQAALQPAKLHKEKASTGQQVFAIGCPAGAGVQRTKSITAGLLSAVDREINGTLYYQFGAPMDPANSGGPLCDDQGDVLGLVALRSSDAANAGYAIPLYDLSIAQFVPSKEWPTDHNKSFQMMEAGRLSWLRSQASPPLLRELYQQLSLQCYQEALLHDPRSAHACDALAAGLMELKRYDEAEGFLWASLQINSWGRNSVTYSRFGELLAEQGKPDEAIVVWREGLAKHPHGENFIWSEITRHYARSQDWIRAMTYASGATRDSRTRDGYFVTETFKGAGLAATDEQVKRINDIIMDEPFKRHSDRVRRIVALKRSRPAITKEFADFVKRSGYQLPPPKLVKEEINMSDNAEAKHLDVLAALHGDRVGDWLVKKNKMKSPAAGLSTITLPEAPLASVKTSYSLYIEVERKSGANELLVSFPASGASATLAIDAAGSKTGFVDSPEGHHQTPVLAKGKPVEIVIDVHPDLIRVAADGEGIVWRKGKLPAAASAAKGDLRLSLGSRDSEFVIHAVHVVALKLIPATDPPKFASTAPKIVTPAAGELAEAPVHWESPESRSGFTSFAFAQNGRFLAAGTLDLDVLIYDMEKKEVAGQAKDEAAGTWVSVCEFSPDGRTLFTAGPAMVITVWGVEAEGQLKRKATFARHSYDIRCLAVSLDGQYALSADQLAMRYWHVETCKEKLLKENLESPIALHIAADGLSAAATNAQTLLWFDLPSGKVTARHKLAQSGYLAFGAFSRDGKRLAIKQNQAINVYDARKGTLETSVPLLATDECGTIVFAGDGTTIVGSFPDKCRVWQLGEVVLQQDVLLEKGFGSADYLRLSADARYLAAAHKFGSKIKVIELTTLVEKK